MSHLDDRLEAVSLSGRFEPEVIGKLKQFVETATDERLFRANPLVFAAEQGLEESRAIALFITAAYAGIFDLAWGVICELCGAFLTSAEGLRSVANEKPCGA